MINLQFILNKIHMNKSVKFHLFVNLLHGVLQTSSDSDLQSVQVPRFQQRYRIDIGRRAQKCGWEYGVDDVSVRSSDSKAFVLLQDHWTRTVPGTDVVDSPEPLSAPGRHLLLQQYNTSNTCEYKVHTVHTLPGPHQSDYGKSIKRSARYICYEQLQ